MTKSISNQGYKGMDRMVQSTRLSNSTLMEWRGACIALSNPACVVNLRAEKMKPHPLLMPSLVGISSSSSNATPCHAGISAIAGLFFTVSYMALHLLNSHAWYWVVNPNYAFL
ncbi:hypothetical protein ACOSP7_022914 [Xanthoceras sorbifolium]